jgi:hypothetical protein
LPVQRVNFGGAVRLTVRSYVIYNSLWRKVSFATKEDLTKRTATNSQFGTCVKVVIQAAHMGRKPLGSRG